MPSAATTVTNNNTIKEKRASVSSIGASSSIGGVGGVGGGSNNGNGNGNSGQHSSNTNLAECVKAVLASTGSQTDLANNNGIGNAKALKAVTAGEPYNPMKQMLVTIDHKIRNLEKRKTKLESYRSIQTGGKELSADQAAAVAKYDAVISTLDFARDLSKQTQQLCKEAEKEQKKQARKDNIAKTVAETAKIRELLTIQNILSCFNDENVRSDFLEGKNGAIKLETQEMEVLEKFCLEVQMRRPETTDDVCFNTTAQRVAELFTMTLNARSKPFGEATFEKLKSIFQQIEDSGYLDKYYLLPTSDAGGNSTDTGTTSGDGETMVNDVGELDTAQSMASIPTSLEDGIDKLQFGAPESGNNGQPELSPHQPFASESAERSIVMLEQRPVEQLVVPPGIGMQQQQPPPLQQTFNANASVSQPSLSAGGSTTPVHVLYAPSPLQQPTQPPSGAGGLPPQLVAASAGAPTPSSAPTHQLLGSPVSLQALHGVAPPPQAGASGPHFGPGPTTVRAVEQSYFKQPPPPLHHHTQQQQQPPPAMQAPTSQQHQLIQIRPWTEVLGTGSFHFLQDSELDAPEVNAPQMPPQQQQPQVPPRQGLIFEAQPPPPQNHAEKAQTIQTLTFTNQSFPSLQQQQQPQQQQLPPPNKQQPSPQQLFSPVTGQPILIPQHDQRQQQQQQPMLIMTRLPPHQQPGVPPQGIGMQPGDVTAVFPYDSAVVSYEQQLQQQLGLKQHIQPVVDSQEQTPPQHVSQSVAQPPLSKSAAGNGSTVDVDSNDWHPHNNDTNAAATAALTNVLKTSSALGVVEPVVASNNWSSEMNAVSATSSNKHEWQPPRDSSVGRGGGGSSGSYIEEGGTSNHWNSGQQDNGSSGRRNSGNYSHRRSGGGDERRDGGGRSDDRGRNGGGNYRSRNYGNSSTQQNGRGGGGSGVYFRNNEAGNGGGSSYYQNGGGVYGNKESRYESSGGGNTYRSQRGGNQRNGNGPFGRPMNDRGRNGSGNGGATGNGGYMNPRQSQQRMPLGLENKN